MTVRLIVALAVLAAPAVHKPKHPEILGPLQVHQATYYSVPPCDNQTTQTASGQRVHFGVIASNFLPLYTWIKFARPLRGRLYFQVLDTGAPFDVFIPCTEQFRGVRQSWNNPTLRYRIVK